MTEFNSYSSHLDYDVSNNEIDLSSISRSLGELTSLVKCPSWDQLDNAKEGSVVTMLKVGGKFAVNKGLDKLLVLLTTFFF